MLFRSKKAIEVKAGGPVKEINRMLGDLMSIRRAVIRRIPVDERSAILKLGDFAGTLKGGPTGLMLAFGNRLLQSGRFAAPMMDAGANMTPGMWTSPAAALAASRGGGSQ